MKSFLLSVLIVFSMEYALKGQDFRQHKLHNSIAGGLSHTQIFGGVKNG